jgi:solute carrier family 13 (sodium-dependent dicarboxylate transporter), member 2/3/5
MTSINKYHLHQIISIVLFALISLNPFGTIKLSQDQLYAVAISVFVAYLWISEAVPMPVASLLMLVFIPLTGIMPLGEAAESFAHPIIFLFMGGFMLGLAFEKWNFHKRIALLIVSKVGFSPNRLILSFMIATCFISMWISNTASTIIMLPIALSIVTLMEQVQSNDPSATRRFSIALLISIAFSSTIGGFGTLIGSPPNALLAGFLSKLYNIELSFVKWMLIGVPFMIMSFIIGYLGLILVFRFSNMDMSQAEAYTHEEIRKIGKLTIPEIYILIVTGAAIFLFVTRDALNALFNTVVLTDTLIMMIAALSFFVLPVRHEKHKFVLQWSDTDKLAWGVLYLFGGALCLANMLQETGLIELMGNSVMKLSNMPPYIILALLLVIILVITELIGGTAICSVFIPTTLAIAVSLNIDMLYIAVPVTLASNVAYLTPVGTAANALVFAKANIRIADMMKAGIVIKTGSFFLLQLFIPWWLKLCF